MNNTGSKKAGLSNIDLILINIALFCACIVLLVVFSCCRKKKPGKRKAVQRKRKKSSKCEEQSISSQSSLSSDSSSGSISSPGKKKSPTGSFTASILHHIKATPQKQNDEESGKYFLKEKKGNKRGNKKKKEAIVKYKVTKMNNEQVAKAVTIDLSLTSNNVQLMEVSPTTNTSSMGTTNNKRSASNKRKCTSNGECPGPDVCKKCKPFRERMVEETTKKTQITGSNSDDMFEDFVEISMPVEAEDEQIGIDETRINPTKAQKLSLYDEIKYPPSRKEKSIPSEQEKTETLNIGNVFDIKEYASREWKGKTPKAQTIREGYFEIPEKLGLYNVRMIRGDNYCGIRATLFQALVQNIPILRYPDKIQQIPQQLMAQDCFWIKEWSFGGRIVSEDTCETMKECLEELSKLVSLSNKMISNEGRESHLLSCFNFQEALFEIRLLEAVKLLMLTSAIKLHEDMAAGKEDVPDFALYLFARDTSENPCQFMKKHLNSVGDTGGLEQVEMHLLGYCLGLTIKVIRPSQHGEKDFIAFYPNDMPPNTPCVTLVAEDDRHYNILI